MKSSTCCDHDDACCKKRKVDDDDENCALHKDTVITDGDVHGHMLEQFQTCISANVELSPNACLPGPIQGSTTSEAKQLGTSARKWDRAVGLRLANAVLLAAHRLSPIHQFTGFKGMPLVYAMTGEVPASTDEAIRALTEKIKELEKEGSPRLTTEKVAAFVPKFNIDEDSLAFLAIGLDWDELRKDFVPSLSFATQGMSWNPKIGYCTGLGSFCSQMVVDNLFKKDMPVEAAEDVALQAIYFGAFSNEVKGQTVEAVEVCVITRESITTRRHDVEDLHAKYGPLVKKRKDELRRNPVPRYTETVDMDEDLVYE